MVLFYILYFHIFRAHLLFSSFCTSYLAKRNTNTWLKSLGTKCDMCDYIMCRNGSKTIWMFSSIPSILVSLDLEWFVLDLYIFFAIKAQRLDISLTMDSRIPFPFFLIVCLIFNCISHCHFLLKSKCENSRKQLNGKEWMNLTMAM